MQALTRALFSLRGACSSSGQLAARSFSEAAAGGPPTAPPGFGSSHRVVAASSGGRCQRRRRQQGALLSCLSLSFCVQAGIQPATE